MFETAGPLAIVESVSLLYLLCALPVLWAMIAALAALIGRAREAQTARLALACSGSTLVLACYLLVRLLLLPHGYVLGQHVAQLVRLGQLDLALDLTIDSRSAPFVVVIALVAFASVLHGIGSQKAGRARTLASTGLLTSSAMLVCIGDGFAPLLVGLGGGAVAAWTHGRASSEGGAFTPIAGNAAATVGLFFLFWSLGGTFGPSGYMPDATPKFVLVSTGPDRNVDDKATLTMTTHAGALVSSDDGPDIPGEPIRAPFSAKLEPGLYTFRIQAGPTSADVVVPRVAIAKGTSYALAPYGPTASLRTLADQINVPRNAASGVATSLRPTLASRTLLGLRVSAVVLFLVLAGALAHAHALARRGGPSTLAVVFEAIPAIYLSVRLAPLVDAASLDGLLVSGLGASSALVLAAGAAAAASEDSARAMRGVLAASASCAVAAVGLGEPASALVLGASSTVAVAAALAALEARRDARWLGVACAAAVGLLPGAGTSFANVLALAAAGAGNVTSWAVGGVLVLSWILATLAAFRVYDATIRTSSPEIGSRIQGGIVIGLAVVALLAGVVLGAGTSLFGGHVVPVARRLVGESTAPAVGKSAAVLAALLSVAAAAAGVLVARRASAAASTPAWIASLDAPRALLGRVADLGVASAQFLGRSVRTVDRDVVQDFGEAARGIFVGTGKGLRRVERVLSERAGKGLLARAFARLSDRLELDHPRRAEQLRMSLVLAMVALLGLVVLSSLLLR